MKASEHFKTYVNKLIDGLVSVDTRELDFVCEMLISAYKKGTPVYVCGNGGSAAISDHFMCDHTKGMHTDTALHARAISLSSNGPTITAIANDIGYDQIYSFQLESLGEIKQGVLVAISASGNSPNIVNAITAAKRMQMTTIAFVGFDGGKCKKLADFCLHVKSDNYGVVEDAHQSLMHIIAQTVRLSYLNTDTIKL